MNKKIISLISAAAIISAGAASWSAKNDNNSLPTVEAKTENSYLHLQAEQNSSTTSSIIKNKISAEKCSISVSDNYTYTGNVINPNVVIKCGNTVLKNGTDYTLTFSQSVRTIGKYTAKAILKGDYDGTIIKDFYVIPQKTEVTISLARVNGFEITAENIPQNCDGYQIQYSKYPCFNGSHVKYVDKSEAKTNIYTSSDGEKYYIRARTYKTVNIDGKSCKIFSDWGEASSARLKKIIVKNGITYVDGILIANKTYSLPSDYSPGVNPSALEAFNRMSKAAAKDGISLYIVSGFRSYDLQNSLYNGYCYERGQEAADRVSARPGHSEHQSGLAFDINTTSSSFAGTPEAKWLDANCYKYGFIIRYMQDKEPLTGYSYEPWHIRYVGNEVAKKVYESGLCLEEYLGITSNYEFSQ